jgi:hypothetical protein
MKYILLAIIISNFLFPKKSYAQNFNWAESKNWKLYDIHDESAFNYPLDTLRKFRNRSLNKDSMLIFVSNLTIIPIERIPVWMGFYVATCEFNSGAIRKIEISMYGGFFYDEKEKKYFQLPVEIRKDWLDYMSDSAAALQSESN